MVFQLVDVQLFILDFLEFMIDPGDVSGLSGMLPLQLLHS